MAAAGNGWITAVVSKGKMTLAFSLLLVLLVDLPHKGDSSIPVVKSKTPSAEECRPHVEKAVDQYFGSKTRDQSTTKDDSTTQIQTPPTDTEDEDDDDDESKDVANPPITTPDKDQEENGDEDDDDESDDDEDESEDLVEKDSRDDDAKLHKEHIDDSKGTVVDDGDEDEDDDDDDDDEDDEDEEDDDSVVNQTVKIDANVVDDDDDEDDDEDEDEINELNENLNEDEDDDDDTDNDVVTKDNITKASDHRTVDNMKHQHREARSTKVETEDNDDEEAEENEEGKAEDEDDDDEEEDEDTDEEEETDDEEDEEEEDDKEEENKPVHTIPKLEPKPDEQKFTTTIPKIQKIPDEKKPTTNIPKIQTARSVSLEKEKESEKATGGPDPAPTRVVQELPRGQPPTQQPKAKEVPEKAQTVIKPPAGGTNQTQEAIKATPITEHEDDDDDDDEEDEDDDLIENIYEEEDDEDDDDAAGLSFRSRVHVDAILNLDHIGTEYDQDEEKLALPIYRDIKKIHAASIKPMEVLYKYTDSTSRLLGDAEIFNKPMILFIGPWSTGKTAIINYLLGIERTPAAFKTGTGITDVDFTVITHGDRRQTISGTELTVDWKYASLQRFGQGFLDHFKAATVPHTLLKKINIVDTPGILENRKNMERSYPFNDVFQWFIDRADAIYVVLEPTKIDVGAELGAVVDQLKGRDVRFILNKADTIRRSDLMRVVGQLFWNLSPLMGSSEAPVIYAVSLSSKPFNPTAPAKFLADQENNFLFDLKDTMEKRVENRILYARRHAVRVRNHAKMVDCYLATYYRHKSIFSNKKNVAKQIVENPADYHIYEGLGNLSNVSRYDIPDESTYKNFFRLHPLYDFRPLASTCSYFRGCPMDKLDAAISSELPELLSKYKKVKSASSSHVKQEGR